MTRIEQLTADISIEMRKLDKMKETIEREKRGKTPEEIAEANSILDTIDNLEAEIATEERLAKTESRVQGDRPPVDAPAGNRSTESRFPTFGQFLQAVIRADASMGRNVDRRLIEERLGSDVSGMNESNPSDGGFLVDKDVSTTLMQDVAETSLLWNEVDHTPISATKNGLKMFGIDESSRADGSRYGGVRAYWADEADTVTGTKPKFRMIEMSLKKLMALCYLTDELMADTVALESVVTKAFRSEMGFKFDDGVINGTGAGQMLGVLKSGALVSISAETGQASTTLLAENIEKMYARNNAKTRAKWYINTDIWPQLFRLHHVIGASGVPLFVPAGGLSSAPLGTILGRPIVELEQCASLGTVGDIIFADLMKYMVIDKGGINQATSIHVRFLYDEQVLRFTWRLDGQPIGNSALTPFKGTANAVSSFTAVATR